MYACHRSQCYIVSQETKILRYTYIQLFFDSGLISLIRMIRDEKREGEKKGHVNAKAFTLKLEQAKVRTVNLQVILFENPNNAKKSFSALFWLNFEVH